MKNFIMKHFNLEEDMIEKYEEIRIENKVKLIQKRIKIVKIEINRTSQLCL